MSGKALVCAALAIVLGGVFSAPPSSAVAPPGQDHAWNVTFSGTTAGSHPDITATLNMCTDGTGLPGIAHECQAGVPASPLFDEATITYTGIRTASPAIASRIATITLDVESNGGLLDTFTNNGAGQPAACGALLHTTVLPFDIWAAATSGPSVSMDPSPVPGFSFDQLDDPAQTDPTPGSVEGDGWPAGISHVPSVVPAILALMGIPDSAVISRGYGVATGVSNTTVTMLTVSTGAQMGTDPTSTIVVFGNPFGARDPAQTNVLNCAPFSATLVTRGSTAASAGSRTIRGVPVAGDYTTPAPGGVPVLTICDASTPAGSTCAPPVRTYSLMLSTSGDDDGDGVEDAADDCPTVPDPVQSSFAGIGDACGGALGVNAGAGYDNNSAAAIASFSAATCSGLPHAAAKALTCADVDGDGVRNAVDNCPFVPNAMQKNRDGDSRGDACEGDGTDPGLIGTGSNAEAFTPGDFSGLYKDFDDRCDAVYAVGGSSTATTTCRAFTPVAGTGGCCIGPGAAFSDADDNGVPDYALAGGTSATRDHKADANGDGYSDADEGSPANCGAAACASLTSYGAAETASCNDPGRHCGAAAISPVGPPRVASGGAGLGCWRSIDTSGALTTANLARSDVDLDGAVSILDLTLVAGWFGDRVGPSDDPRWEGNMDGDGFVSILDLAAMASNYGRIVSTGCTVE